MKMRTFLTIRADSVLPRKRPYRSLVLGSPHERQSDSAPRMVQFEQIPRKCQLVALSSGHAHRANEGTCLPGALRVATKLGFS